MAEKSSIAWTRSTFNPWIGCTKVGPGCDHCYAETLDKRMQYGKAVHWGAGVPRYRTSAKNWQGPVQWNVQAMKERSAGERWNGQIGFWPVFCASLADVFDNEVPPEWFWELSCLINATPNLSWLLVTKRIGRVKDAVPSLWMERGFPDNVRLLITVCNQEEADRDIPKLLALPCKNGISYEPALGPVDWRPWFYVWQCKVCGAQPDSNGLVEHGKGCYTQSENGGGESFEEPYRGLEWIIVGGESTQGAGKARPFDVGWARSTIAQCKDAGVPVFVKQLGSKPTTDFRTRPEGEPHYWATLLKDRAGADPAEWPEDLRVQEFPA